MDYKQQAIQYHLHYQNLKQRLDLAHRSVDTIDYRIQLETHHQRGLKSVLEKYEDPKYDQAFQFLLTHTSNTSQVLENLINELSHTKDNFRDKVEQFIKSLNIINDKKEKIIQRIRGAFQKQQQSQCFYLSISKVYERNLAALDYVNESLEQRVGHIKVIQDLQRNKENTFVNYKIATDRYNQALKEALPEFQLITNDLVVLEKEVSETIRSMFQCIVIAELSAVRNKQYDLEQLSKFLEKVDYTKVNTVFKYTEECFKIINPDILETYLTRPTQELAINYKIIETNQQIPILKEDIDEETCENIKKLQLLTDNNNGIEIVEKLEQKLNSVNAQSFVDNLSNQFKAPIGVSKQVYHLLSQFFHKLLDHTPKDGHTIHKIQKMSTFIHCKNTNQETMTIFQVISQHPIFSKKNEYWEWLLYWQIRQTAQGVHGEDKQLIIFQQFQIIAQQMAQLHIQTTIIITFLQDLAPYYQVKHTQLEDIKKMLFRFINATNLEPNFKGDLQTFDCVE